MSQLPTLIFSYRVEDILDEVTKRTSYIGKMRSTDQEPYVVDRLSLTKGEGFMFSEFLEDAVSQTYDWLKAFGRKIPMYDKIVLKYEDMKMIKDYGAQMKIGGNDANLNEKIKINIEGLVKEDDSTLTVGHSPIVLTNDSGESINASVEHTLVLHTTLNDKPVTKTIEYVKSNSVDAGSSWLFEAEEIPFEFTEDGYEHKIDYAELDVFVTVSPVEVKPIKKDTYVEYHTDFSDDSVFDVYQVNASCTNADWLDYACKLAVDPRGCVIFILERSCNMDMNMISSIDRNIKEAIVDFIIYKWFEYTNVSESEAFYNKFEFYAREAKNGMDSEKNIMQRKYNINH